MIMIGSGGFGFVCSGQKLAESKLVSIKFIFKSKIPINSWIIDSELGRIPFEVYILKFW